MGKESGVGCLREEDPCAGRCSELGLEVREGMQSGRCSKSRGWEVMADPSHLLEGLRAGERGAARQEPQAPGAGPAQCAQ